MDNLFNQIENSLNNTKESSNIYVNKIINKAILPEAEIEQEHKFVYPEKLKDDPFDFKLTSDELKLEGNFIGCYVDDPSNPGFKDYLGEVENQEQCITRGKEKNYNFVGIQQGNKCFGSNIIPEDMIKADRIRCSVSCTDSSKGKCGGYYYNQVYSTNNTNLSKPSDIVEKFKIMNLELFDISKNLQEGHFVTENPINPYSLLLWLIVILILIYIIVEYLNKKSKEKNYYN